MNRCFFILLLLANIAAMADHSLIINPIVGEEYNEMLSNIGYIKMTTDTLAVYSHTGVILSKNAIKDIQHIRYNKDLTYQSSIETSPNATLCRIYPNPTQDMLIIEHAGCEKAHIFDLSGRLLQTITITGEQTTVDVSYLPHGEYLILLNSQMAKFIKQ